MSLEPKHQEFVNRYLKHFNAIRAYKEVYQCSDESANANAYRVMGIDGVRLEITRRIDEVKKRFPEEIIEHLKNLVLFDVSQILDEDGNIDNAKLKEHCIPGIISGMTQANEVNEEYKKTRTTFKLTDQNKAIEILSKMLKIYDDSPKTNVFNFNVTSKDEEY